MSTSDHKGKRRAQDPSEHTPLLPTASPSYSLTERSTTTRINRTLRSKLTYVFLFSFLCCILAFVVIAILAWSYASRASSMSPEELLASSVVFQGPSHINVLNITEAEGIWVRIAGRLGVDAGSVIGVHRDAYGDNFLEDIWKSVGRWGVRRLDKVSVELSTIHITPEYDSSLVLASVNVPPLDVPLTPDPPSDQSWLTDVSIPLRIKPTTNSSTILHFLRESWVHRRVDIRANVQQASVIGGALNEESWRSLLRRALSNIRQPLHIHIPSLPGLPSPGHTFPSMADLITLSSFHILSRDDKLLLAAQASVVNPTPPELEVAVPLLPFEVSLPSTLSPTLPSVPVASVSTSPFILTHPNATIDIVGSVLSIPSSSSPVLSNFLSRYLSRQSNPISISSPFLPGLSIATAFPGPKSRPQLLQNVTIRDMKIKPKGDAFLASGIVSVRLVLPKGMDVALDVHRVLPDVLVFNGEVTNLHDALPEVPLPDPLPEHAFGHIRPEDWLPSLCVRDGSKEGEGAAYSISAVITDVPLEVLPGRQKQFSSFVRKVIFGSEGAIAGLQGTASVVVDVEGLPVHGPEDSHALELNGLPFHGRVRVGKKSTSFHE
ncbi:hypothetical protein AMATHDRAFT_143158 [Amanita thiersii Skay4041]|uniref:Uncharacterized protein n=1 Tax=Amanita thiersii Skay4041 TaxID=703135 RepID=A0A2A9NKR4_9AGAR|nr:hypothetical protein AMATHDRAFT_143158 [Amanita thiersii Skay4041]